MAEKKIKILAAGDIHGDSSLTRKLAEQAEKENVDLVILAGDITSPIEVKNLLKPFKDKNKKVLILPGNHDSFATVDFLAELYGMKNIHGYAIKSGGIGIFGAGGAIGFDTTEKEIFSTLEKGNKYIGDVRKKIMVTHMHSAGTHSEFSGIKGSKSIKKAIEKFHPDFLLHSHIHEAEGIEQKIGNTTIINVGRRGKILEI
ncbi:metallophosphoesterase [Candidatus Pacearchaeota archaeon]|nr:metallophosphoesterase [Candidatus Pacearchaeota archaeon]